MKRRMESDGAKSLGGEFFLADEGLIRRTWAAGQVGAEERLKSAK